MLYCILQDVLQEMEDDEHVSTQYPFEHERVGEGRIFGGGETDRNAWRGGL